MTRHRFDTFSFLAGAIAVTVGVLVLADVFTLRVIDLRVIGPVLVLALGLALLVGGGRDAADDAADDDEIPPAPDEAGDPDATDAVDETDRLDAAGS